MVDEAKIRISIDRSKAESELSEIKRKGIRRTDGGISRIPDKKRGVTDSSVESDRRNSGGGGLVSASVAGSALNKKSRFGQVLRTAAVGAEIFLVAKAIEVLVPQIEGVVFETLKQVFPNKLIEPIEKVTRTLVDKILVEKVQQGLAIGGAAFKSAAQTQSALTGLAAAERGISIQDAATIAEAEFSLAFSEIRNQQELAEALLSDKAQNLVKGIFKKAWDQVSPDSPQETKRKSGEEMRESLRGGGRSQ